MPGALAIPFGYETVAGLSPLSSKPRVPVPAAAVKVPSSSTRSTRWSMSCVTYRAPSAIVDVAVGLARKRHELTHLAVGRHPEERGIPQVRDVEVARFVTHDRVGVVHALVAREVFRRGRPQRGIRAIVTAREVGDVDRAIGPLLRVPPGPRGPASEKTVAVLPSEPIRTTLWRSKSACKTSPVPRTVLPEAAAKSSASTDTSPAGEMRQT